ncbi:MAG: beta-lactamase-like protein [Candidatus Nomurabacteria bacterium]|jgi:L-ascorbate metabolism protein UlaG (beta-lactamase superfamily)|nr:beta-lactamase-like protein [Candidatus Nomurabacteria bacterium]
MAIQQLLDNDLQRQRQEMEALLVKINKPIMKIKKIGHCCLIIETKGIRIMTDPGMFTTAQDEEKNINIVIISHEHGDHFHVESLKNVLANNPEAKVITNSAVGKLLDGEGIAYEVVEHAGTTMLHDILIEGFGEHHAVIYKEMGQVQNTGYFIDGRLFYPGDAFTNPNKPVDILALPVAGPWMKISEALDYAFAVKPTYAFPVHDGVLKNPTMMQGMYAPLFQHEGITFVPMGEGTEHDFS